MKASWMVLPLVLGLASLTVACDTAGNTEAEEQLETEPSGLEPVEGEEEEEEEGGGDD
ncbi:MULTISPECIES: hypothetical protein [Cyanophyceae]|uniref:hypothetical protein n=1 Tax=Cyanophyceae TaxID=3028117 RepID=UPI00168934AC|nr:MULTISPECIES: hypothetical protein [Cyanophyceae]MBD1915056.1 hypothetical protein [Phormidium sp. FACHB-77]MBD2030802.1 hypothetical protein [Phormidium sp. FACHB-322]MBD2053156.1 hypothetical protein [Leptolyngbya sp. FACHB-60]